MNPVTQMGPMNPPESTFLPLARFWNDESGQDLIEYALVAACVGLGAITGVHGIAVTISHSIGLVMSSFSNVVSAAS